MFSALEMKVEEKTRELENIYFSVLLTLAQAMEKKDIGTYGHCRRVSHYSRLIAVALDLNEKDREDLKTAAMLHDIGKIGISDFILGKTGALNNDEIYIVRHHPENGIEILKPLKQFESILPAILHHHENYDGSGYPHGLSGDNIPLLARIIAIVDTYDAILSNRPYRSGREHADAIEELQRFSGKQFDPEIVNAFVKADSRYNKVFAQECG
jgi:putative nucleotidyltransferase with HDIG domain